MFNRKSIYALNKKDPDAIVYMDANEVIVRLTREYFARREADAGATRPIAAPQER